MEIKEIYIKNFRNIGEEGAEIKLSPITIFTGCNSAGKSTAAKALLLLEAYLSDVKSNNYNLIDTPLDFSKVVKLGTFDSVLNSSSKANGQDYIVLGYSYESAILMADMHIWLSFAKKNDDNLHNGWLKELKVSVNSKDMLSINIVDDIYKIEFHSGHEFVEYVNCYKVQQILALWHNRSNIFEKVRNEAIYENKMSELSAVKRNLHSKGIIKERLWTEDIDIEIDLCDVRDIVAAIECILDLSGIYNTIFDIEEREGRRFNEEDLEKIVKSYIDKHQSLLDTYPDLQEKIIQIRSKYQSYINSGAKDVLEFTKNLNNGCLAQYAKDFNQDDFKDVIGNGVLDAISNQLSKNVMPKWVRLAFHYLISRSLSPNIIGQIEYVDASTVDVKRLYLLDSSDRFGNLWKRYNNLSCYPFLREDIFHDAQKPWAENKGTFMNKWLREFGICDKLKIENIEGSLRIKLFTRGYPEGRLLADFGYGITQLVSLLLNIEIALNKVIQYEPTYAGQNFETEPGYVGYYNSWLIIEEPEVHLHPSLQSRLADMFLDATQHGVHFIVETHSEYLVRRSQVIVASMFSKNPKYIPAFGVYYFPNDGVAYDMRYKTNGHFAEAFGEGFFDEAGRWSRKLMRSKK